MDKKDNGSANGLEDDFANMKNGKIILKNHSRCK